eukprot:9182678-Pyramimonas_sp.AAC.1
MCIRDRPGTLPGNSQPSGEEDCPKAALCEATERNDALADKPQRDLEQVQEEPTAPLAATASAK